MASSSMRLFQELPIVTLYFRISAFDREEKTMNGLSRRNWIVLLALLLWFCGRTMVARCTNCERRPGSHRDIGSRDCGFVPFPGSKQGSGSGRSCERMTVKDGGTPQATITTDQYGNGMGGVRSPYVDVPAATYVPHTPGQAICRNLGYKVAFDWVRLERMYGSSRNYASKVRQSVDRLLKERWITESDAQKTKTELITPARTTSNNN